MIRAVVIDDDHDTVEVFSEFLMLRNVEIVGKGYNGLDGVRLFEEKKPDVVFSDIWMPDYDGFYLLETLKKSNPDANIVMVTADLTQETDQRLKASNADAVIFKPFKIDEIMEIINEISKKNMAMIS